MDPAPGGSLRAGLLLFIHQYNRNFCLSLNIFLLCGMPHLDLGQVDSNIGKVDQKS